MRNSELENYISSEILKGIEIPINSNSKNTIYEYFGNPIEEIVEIEEDFRDSYEGINSLVERYSTGPIGVRKIIYNDLIHVFSILKRSPRIYVEVYNGVEIINPIERLKTINIGDDANKLIEIFGDDYYRDNNTIIYFNIPGSINFYIENDVIIKIKCIFFHYE